MLPELPADLKERAAGIVYARIKTEVCDPTGCTVDVVDHMPWATDNNRKRLRGYGDVFKNAAVRAGLYIDADGNKLYVEARGNNIRGFKRTPAFWDSDTLELRLLEARDTNTEALDAAVLEHVKSHPGDSTNKVEEAVEGGRESIRQTLVRLATSNDIAPGPGRNRRGKYWYPRNHPVFNSPGDLLATSGESRQDTLQEGMSPDSPTPRRGGELAGDMTEELADAWYDDLGRTLEAAALERAETYR